MVRCGMAEIDRGPSQRRPSVRPSRAAGPPPHQFRSFSLDTVIWGLSNMCPGEVADGEVALTWEIPTTESQESNVRPGIAHVYLQA